MAELSEKNRKAIQAGTWDLLTRAVNRRSLETADISDRIGFAVEKYLLRDDPQASTADIKDFVENIRADDFCLVAACERGDEKAWEELVTSFDATVKSAARKIANNAEDAEDLAGSIWAELYGLRQDAEGNKKSKLAYYSGRGSLAGWLRAVVSQLAVDGFRKQSKLVQIEENREFENLANDAAEHSNNGFHAHRDNPEEVFSEKQTADDVSKALKTAIASMEAEDRLFLKLYYFDDLKLKDIAKTFDYHEATASRRLVRIQTYIRKSVEKSLKNDHGWTESEVKRHLSETASKLGINVENLVTLALIAAVLQDLYISCVL